MQTGIILRKICSKADNVNELDEVNFYKYLTSVRSKRIAEISIHKDDKFLDLMPNNTHLEGFSTFDEVTDEFVLNYIYSIAINKYL